MEGLNVDSILGNSEIDTLFTDYTDSSQEEEKETKQNNEEIEVGNESPTEETTEETNPFDLFEQENPESVGSEEEKEEHKEKEVPEAAEAGTSPDNKNFYSSIANACAEEGIFPDLDEETIQNVKSAEDFRSLIESQISAGLDERQKRIDQALNSGVEPSEIKKYEGTLQYLNSITTDALSEENDQAENLRKSIIYQDFLNRGYSPQKAQKFTERSVEAGTDIGDAKEALLSNKEFFQNQYNRVLSEAKAVADKNAKERDAQVNKLKTSILEDSSILGDIEIDKNTRRKVIDNISRPVYRDPDTGEYFTAIQKYEMENRSDFLKYVGTIFTVTNGFKNFDSFVKGKVKKEVKKGLKELEHTLNTTRRDNSGNLELVSSAQSDPNSFIGRGLKLDL